MATSKVVKRLFFLSIRDASQKIVDVISHPDYETLLLEGVERAKAVNGSWEIHDAYARFVDGSK